MLPPILTSALLLATGRVLSTHSHTVQVNYLKEFGLEIEVVGKLLAYKPKLMICSIEDKWKPLGKYFYYLGISKDGLRRMLTIKPVVFCLDLETVIVPKVQLFKDIGVQDVGISNMLVKFPSLLTFSLYKKIRLVVLVLWSLLYVIQRFLLFLLKKRSFLRS